MRLFVGVDVLCEAVEDVREEFVEAFILEGGDGENVLADTKAVEFGAGIDTVLVVGFVDNDVDWPIESTEVVGEIPVGGVDAIYAVGNEEDDIGLGHCNFGLSSDLVDEGVFITEEDSSGIDDAVFPLFPLGFGVESVAGDAGGIFDDGEAVPDESVEHR